MARCIQTIDVCTWRRVQVVLSGFSMRLFCYVQAKTLCRYGCIYCLASLVLMSVYIMMVISPCGTPVLN